MLCPRCMLAASRRTTIPVRSSSQFVRLISNGVSRLASSSDITASTQTTVPPRSMPPSMTSTTSGRPSSASATDLISAAATPALPPAQPDAAARSSVAAGTVLRGLNYFKGRPDPVALEDAEYPPWLWEVLAEKKSLVNTGETQLDPRLFSKSAKARRVAAKKMRAQAAAHPDALVPRVPLYEQSVDLPAEAGAREELTKAMRARRRKGIKEANFLKSMS